MGVVILLDNRCYVRRRHASRSLSQQSTPCPTSSPLERAKFQCLLRAESRFRGETSHLRPSLNPGFFAMSETAGLADDTSSVQKRLMLAAEYFSFL